MDNFNLAKAQTTPVYNIQDLINSGKSQSQSLQNNLPYDIISLQKNIDHWTQQEYSGKFKEKNKQVDSTKQIPDSFFTTQALETTTVPEEVTFESAETNNKETILRELLKDIETNLILSETTTEVTNSTKPIPLPFSTQDQKSSWEVAQVTVSPLTKEKVYVVTPQSYKFDSSTPATAWSMAPKVKNGTVNGQGTFESSKFSVRVEAQNKTGRELVHQEGQNSVKVVYSEWPHLSKRTIKNSLIKSKLQNNQNNFPWSQLRSFPVMLQSNIFPLDITIFPFSLITLLLHRNSLLLLELLCNCVTVHRFAVVNCMIFLSDFSKQFANDDHTKANFKTSIVRPHGPIFVHSTSQLDGANNFGTFQGLDLNNFPFKHTLKPFFF